MFKLVEFEFAGNKSMVGAEEMVMESLPVPFYVIRSQLGDMR